MEPKNDYSKENNETQNNEINISNNTENSQININILLEKIKN